MDLEKQRSVPQQEAEDYAVSVGAQHFGTSAKQNRGVQDAFVNLTKDIIERRAKSGGRGGGRPGGRGGRAGKSKLILVPDEPEQAPAAGGCC